MSAFTIYPNKAAVVADIYRIAAKTGQSRVADELLDDIKHGRVQAVGFGYFGERGTLVYSTSPNVLHVHAVYSHEIGVDEACAVAEELARKNGVGILSCNTVRGGLAFKLIKRGFTAVLTKKL
jgi:hypothetical protein